jgi:hypothetical protein
MTKRCHLFLGLLATLIAAGQAHAEQVDNPQYQAWSRYKAGTTVTSKMEIGAQGFNMTQDVTQTLKEITADKAVVEVAMTTNMGGMSRPMSQTREIPAKVEKGQEYITPDVKGTMKETGNETVEVAGKKYDCKIMEFTGESARGGKSNGKVWVSKEIPGGMAKMESTGEGGGGGGTMQATIKMTVTGFELK